MASTYDQLLAQGRAEGYAEGYALLLLAQLEARFGTLEATVRERLLSAGVDQLQSWAIRLLDAPSLVDVFRDATRSQS